MKYFTTSKISLISLFSLVFFLSACSLKSETENAPISISGLSLINASPTIEKLDVFIESTRASKDDFSFGEKMDYLNAYSGNHILRVTKKGSTTILSTAQIKLEPTFGYSLFVTGRVDALNFLLLKDDLVLPETGKAKIRFVNLSPDAGALSLGIAGKTVDLTAAKSFKEYSNFEVVDAAEKLTFNAKNSNGGIEASIVDVKIESGKIYTIWVKGLKAETDVTKLGLSVFAHK